MGVISMKALLEAGVHFGHQTRRWNPKMAKYIYTSRNGIHIIDLQKTSECIDIAYKAMFDIVQTGGRVLFVGTKKQSQDPVKEEAIRSGQFYVDKRWLGGTLTNFKTIKRSIKKLHDLYKMESDGTFAVLPKKEVIGLRKEMERLEKFLGGIKDMKILPEAVFIIDPRKERNAILESKKLGIPVFGIIDTNCDPDEVDYIIPANDDALRSVKLIVSKMADAIIEANGGLLHGEGETEDAAESSDILIDETEEPVKEKPAKVEVKTEPRPHTPRPEVKRAPAQTVPAAQPKPIVKTVEPAAKPVSEPKPVIKVVEEAKVEIKAVKEEVKEEVKAVKEEVKEKVKAVKEKVKEEVKEVIVEATNPKPGLSSEELEAKTVNDLKEIAKDLNVTNISKLRKAELIQEILNSQQ